MEVKVLRSDQTEVNLHALTQKIIQKAQLEEDEDEALLCAQESLRLLNHLSQVPLVSAMLMIINKEIIRILTNFFFAGYTLGRAIDKNDLSIYVQREDDDSNSTNTQSNPTHSNPDSD